MDWFHYNSLISSVFVFLKAFDFSIDCMFIIVIMTKFATWGQWFWMDNVTEYNRDIENNCKLKWLNQNNITK